MRGDDALIIDQIGGIPGDKQAGNFRAQAAEPFIERRAAHTG